MIRFNIHRRGYMALLAVLAVTCHVRAQDVVVTGATRELVPIALSGFSGEVDQVLRFDLEVAGFALVAADKASYLLNGKNDTQVEGTLTDKDKRSLFNGGGRAYPGGSPRNQAHALADDVVQMILKTPGIARTKIAFKHETGQRNQNKEMISEVFVADYDGANAFQLTQDGTVSRSPAWQPDHRTLFYTSFRPGRPCIFSHDLATGARSPISNFNGMNDGAAISPDGTKISMVLSKGGSPDIWVGNIDGSGLRQLTSTREAESSPCWSPDSRTLCFSSSEGGGTKLQLIDADGGAPRPLNIGGLRGATEPDWSPDGKYIAFTRMGGGENFQIYRVKVGGGTPESLGAGEDPSWAPNSRTLAVIRRQGNVRKLSLLDAETRQAKDLLTISGSCGQPSWAK